MRNTSGSSILQKMKESKVSFQSSFVNYKYITDNEMNMDMNSTVQSFRRWNIIFIIYLKISLKFRLARNGVFCWWSPFISKNLKETLLWAVANVLDRDIVSEFELQSNNYAHFRTIILKKSMKLFYPLSYWLVPLLRFYKDGFGIK